MKTGIGTPSPQAGRLGFTLIELLISILVFGIIIAGAMGFLASQNDAFRRGTERMEAIQNLRYAAGMLESDLRTLGTNLPGDQPSLVYAGDDVVAFSADYASNTPNDIFAVYSLPEAPPGQVMAPTAPLVIPNSTYSWPTVSYQTTAGTNSPAELLMFFFRPDSSTTRDDDYVLFRKINNQSPELLARNLLQDPEAPFFRYLIRRNFASANPALDSIADDDLPLIHLAARHGSPGDTGRSALADSVRAVRVSFGATNGLEGDYEHTSFLTRVVRLPNAGLTLIRTCGDEPILSTGLSALPVVTADGRPAVELTWSPSVDEAAGEKDVVRYVVWRRPGGAPDWGEPLLSVPAGQPSYLYEDSSVAPGLYQYAVAAQDCTPTLSSLVTSVTVLVP